MDDKPVVSNQQRIGNFIAEQMENIEQDFDGQEYQIGDMISIVEIILPGEDETSRRKSKSYIRTREATPSLQASIGLIKTAEMLMMKQWGFDSGPSIA